MKRRNFIISVLLCFFTTTFTSCANYKDIDLVEYSNKDMPSISIIMNAIERSKSCSSEEISNLIRPLLDNSRFEYVDSGTFYRLSRYNPSVETIHYICIGQGNKKRELFKKKVCFNDGLVIKHIENSTIFLQLYFKNRKEMLAYLKQAENVGFSHLDYGKLNFFFFKDIEWAIHPDDEETNVLKLTWE